MLRGPFSHTLTRYVRFATLLGSALWAAFDYHHLATEGRPFPGLDDDELANRYAFPATSSRF